MFYCAKRETKKEARPSSSATSGAKITRYLRRLRTRGQVRRVVCGPFLRRDGPALVLMKTPCTWAGRTEHSVEIYFRGSDRNRAKYYGEADICFFNCAGVNFGLFAPGIRE